MPQYRDREIDNAMNIIRNDGGIIRLWRSLGKGMLWLCALCLWTACGSLQLDEETTSTTAVRVRVRSVDNNELSSPIQVFAFSAGGQLIARQSMETADEELQLNVPRSEEIRIVALSADPETYSFPASPKLDAVIQMNAPRLPSEATEFHQRIAKGFVTSHPLQMGCAQITPTSEKASVSLQMNYWVTSLQVSLTGMPADCSAAYVAVKTPAQGVTLTGNLVEASATSCIPLYPPNWTTGKVYLFPTLHAPTEFTIAYEDGEGEQFAQVNYMGTLRQGVPYELQGVCSSEGLQQVSGTITPSSWESPVQLDFTFSPDVETILEDNGQQGGSVDDGSDTTAVYSVTEIPQPLSVWNGHIVVAQTSLTDNATNATLLLMSLADEGNFTSAYHADTPDAASSYAESYEENGLKAWRIPTTEEARALRNAYVEQTDAVENCIAEADAYPIVLTDEKGNNLRYLCNEATQTYSFKTGSSYNSIKDAGATVKNYRLRLVRTVRVRIQ